MWVFPEMAYTKFMITCMLHFRESYPESCPRIIPANHTTNHTHDFNKGGRNIPRNIPPKHASETYLESYPLMQHALLGTEFSERAIYIRNVFLFQCGKIIFSLFSLGLKRPSIVELCKEMQSHKFVIRESTLAPTMHCNSGICSSYSCHGVGNASSTLISIYLIDSSNLSVIIQWKVSICFNQ